MKDKKKKKGKGAEGKEAAPVVFPVINSTQVITKTHSSGKRRPYTIEARAYDPDTFELRLNGTVAAHLQREGLQALVDAAQATLDGAAGDDDGSDEEDPQDPPPADEPPAE